MLDEGFVFRVLHPFRADDGEENVARGHLDVQMSHEIHAGRDVVDVHERQAVLPRAVVGRGLQHLPRGAEFPLLGLAAFSSASAGTAADSTSLTRRSYNTSTSQVKRRASEAMRTGMCGTLDSSTVWNWLAISR